MQNVCLIKELMKIIIISTVDHLINNHVILFYILKMKMLKILFINQLEQINSNETKQSDAIKTLAHYYIHCCGPLQCIKNCYFASSFQALLFHYQIYVIFCIIFINNL